MISRRHRRRLNRAVHELRRPLQVLALLEGGGEPGAGGEEERARSGLLELARCALRDLDAELNGDEVEPVRREVSCRELLEAALERWRPTAEARGGFRVFWDAGPAPVLCDPVRFSQALDNLIANALEHGGPPLVVTGASVAGRLRITFANGAGTAGGNEDGNAIRPGDRGAASADRYEQGPEADHRGRGRGHGVGIVSRVAAEHRGRFALCRTDSGCVAALEVPLHDGGLARAA